jgi:hypothetical protein
MASAPEYSNIVTLWQDIKEDIPDLLSNPYTWLEEQLNIAAVRRATGSGEKQLETLMEIMHTLISIHFHIHEE